MYSDMSMRTIASCAVEHELGQRARQLGLADAGRAEEQERADRPVGVLQARRASGAARCATAATASSWPMTRWCRRSSMWTSFSTSPSSRRLTGMPVQRATTSAMSSASTSSLRKPAARRRSARLGLGELAPRARGSRRSAARRRARGRPRARRARARVRASLELARLTSRDALDRRPSRPATRPSSRRAARAARRARARSPRGASADASSVSLRQRRAARSRAA